MCPAVSEVRKCSTDVPCPVDCVVSAFATSGACSATCGGGTQKQVRSVVTPSAYGGKVCPALEQLVPCNTHACPQWTTGDWSTCSATCGGGVQQRRVSCSTGSDADCGAPTDGTCDAAHTLRVVSNAVDRNAWFGQQQAGQGMELLVDRCVAGTGPYCGSNAHVPDDGSLIGATITGHGVAPGTKITAYSYKTTYSGQHLIGFTLNQKLVDTQGPSWCFTPVNVVAATKATKPAALQECNLQACPVDCQVSAWTPYTKCSASCGGGVAARTRTITTQPLHGGRACPELHETKACATHSCPPPCQVSDWSAWVCACFVISQ
jgi:semaphorin 5